jgi:Major Facilitator Superfamily
MTTNEQVAPANTRSVFLYFGPLTLLVYLVVPHGYFLDIATSYMMKNQLHATPSQVAFFRLVTAIPVYLSVVFGFARDWWNPLGLRDRGFFIVFAPLTAAVFLWMALSNLSFEGLFAGMLLVMTTFRFIAAAHQGLLALIGQEKLMSGRLAALWQIFGTLPYVVGAFASGLVAEYLKPRETFLLMTVLCAALVIFGIWKPKAVFKDAYDKPAAKGAGLIGDMKRLVRHRAVYPAVIIMFMFQFAPGGNTPLQYYLSNTLHASDEIYGFYYAVFAAAFIPVWFIYGYICKFVSLEKLLWWGTILTIPQMIPLIFIHSGTEAVFWALPMGLAGGIAGVAYFDLAMRSCPPGLQGTLMMMVDGVYQLSYRGSDVLGVQLYNSSPKNGFLYCVIATTAVYALILPMLLLIPKKLIATKDGEHNIEMEAGQADERAPEAAVV